MAMHPPGNENRYSDEPGSNSLPADRQEASAALIPAKVQGDARLRPYPAKMWQRPRHLRLDDHTTRSWSSWGARQADRQLAQHDRRSGPLPVWRPEAG